MEEPWSNLGGFGEQSGRRNQPAGRDAFHRVPFWLLAPDVPRREEWDGVESVPTTPPVGTRSTASHSGSCLPICHNEKSGREWNPSLPTAPVRCGEFPSRREPD